MLKPLSFCAVALFALTASRAETPPEYDIDAWQARAAEMRETCTADRDSPECAIAAQGVRSDMARALLMLFERGDREATEAAARRMLALSPPELKTAAAYVIARLGPSPDDTPTFVALLNDRSPSLRRAAFGVLLKSPDPAAREWVQRARHQATGERFTDDERITDETKLGVALPPGTAPVWFEMQAWAHGAQFFTADGGADGVLAHFSAIAGGAPIALSDAAARFATDNDAKAMFERYANAAWFADPRVVVLDEGATDGNAARPVRLAVVWDDILFGKAGFALQWVSSRDMPGYHEQPWRDPDDWIRTAKIDERKLGEPGSLSSEWRKPGADDLENTIYLNILASDGLGALDYLDRFPSGHYRAEVEALLAAPRITVDDAALIEPGEIRIGFENMPTDRPIRFDVVRRPSSQQAADMREADSPQEPTEPVTGQASGEVVWKPHSPLRPGLYDIRVFYGPFQMDWDGDALRRYMPGDEAQFRRSIRILPRIVKLSPNKSEYAPGESVVIAYEDMPAALSPGVGHPFITLVEAAAPSTDWRQYEYASEAAGTLTLQAPSKPGAYQLRALFSQDGILQGVADIKVLEIPAATPTPAPTLGPTPVPTPLPNDPNITITLAKPAFAPDEPIEVTVKGLSGDKRDWIAVVPAGAEEGTTGKWVYSDGVTEGSFTLPGQPAGSYEIRVRFKDQYRPVRAWIAFEVK